MTEFFKIIAALAVVIPFIFMLAYCLKRFTRFVPSTGSDIKICKQLSIGIKERILVVEVEGVKLVIGVSPHAFNTLYILDKNDNTSLYQQN